VGVVRTSLSEADPHDPASSAEGVSMTARLGPWLGIGFILGGAFFVVAALGAMSTLGFESAPAEWIYGVTCLVAGRLLLSEPRKSSHIGQDLVALKETD
jgi:hypothetical protein